MFDMSGRMGRCGVTVIQEIRISPFILHIINVYLDAQCFINAARISKVRFCEKHPDINFPFQGSSEGRLSTLSSEGGPARQADNIC